VLTRIGCSSEVIEWLENRLPLFNGT
jgi:hypothetical protein